jgi:hypothetical protein
MKLDLPDLKRFTFSNSNVTPDCLNQEAAERQFSTNIRLQTSKEFQLSSASKESSNFGRLWAKIV